MDDDAVLLSRKFVAGWEHSEEFEAPRAGRNVWPDQCRPKFKLRRRSFAPMKSCYFCQHADFHLNTTFEGLSSSSEYKIMARYQETDAYQASPTSEAVIRTDTPSSSPSYSNKIEETEHGTVKVSDRTPEAGQKVTHHPPAGRGLRGGVRHRHPVSYTHLTLPTT